MWTEEKKGTLICTLENIADIFSVVFGVWWQTVYRRTVVRISVKFNHNMMEIFEELFVSSSRENRAEPDMQGYIIGVLTLVITQAYTYTRQAVHHLPMFDPWRLVRLTSVITVYLTWL